MKRTLQSRLSPEPKTAPHIVQIVNQTLQLRISQSGHVLAASTAFLSLLGQTPAQVVGRTWHHFLAKEHHKVFQAALRASQASSRPVTIEAVLRPHRTHTACSVHIVFLPCPGGGKARQLRLRLTGELSETDDTLQFLIQTSHRLAPATSKGPAQVAATTTRLGVAKLASTISCAYGGPSSSLHISAATKAPAGRKIAQQRKQLAIELQKSSLAKSLKKNRENFWLGANDAGWMELIGRALGWTSPPDFVRHTELLAISLCCLKGEAKGLLILLDNEGELLSGAASDAKRHGFAAQASIGLAQAERLALARQQSERGRQLLAVVSHDLRNPLATLTLKLERLARGASSNDDPLLMEKINNALSHVARMDGLVNDLVDSSGLKQGSLSLSAQAVDSSEIVADLLENTEKMLMAKALRIDVSNNVSSRVWCDPHRIRQVLVNLVGNACKYAPVGTPIEISSEAGDSHVVFNVRDHGRGVEKGDHKRIFEAFVRGARAATDRGLGLGLSICREIVQASGGRIWVETPQGAGALFRFTLPRA